MHWVRVTCLGLCLGFAPPCAAQDSSPKPYFDLVIRNGILVDGTGAPRRRADLAIRDGRIVELGRLPESTEVRAEIDAKDLVVAPGFIDVHAHADRAAARRGEARNFALMGVTTIVSGNCGGSESDLGNHFDQVERRGISVNYASLIGHGTVRRAAMGTANRAPSEDELKAMLEHVRRAMTAGACGMSTGLIYVPGTYADTDELAALCEVVHAFGGVYASHMRNEGQRVLESIAEAIKIGDRSGVRVHLSHLKASGKPSWGRSEPMVEALRAARAAGKAVTGDQYAYCASSTGLEVLFPSRELAIGRGQFCAKLADDENFRLNMRRALQRTAKRVGFEDFHYCQVAYAPGHRSLSGMRIDEAAESMLGGSELDQQIETVIRLMIDSKGRRIQMVYHKMQEPDVDRIMREPYVAIAADAGIRVYNTESKPHPRGAGNNPRVLGRYVRERKTISLELAVQKMTSLPANVFRLVDRGVVREGACADLTLFDPAVVSDRATYAEPTLAPVGIPYVIVNGTVVIERGKHTKARPGMVLRHDSAR